MNTLLATVALLCSRILVQTGRVQASGEPCINNDPLIGVLTQPGLPAPKGQSYVAASYIKFIEAGGARAVPIMYDAPHHEVKDIFDSINGVIIPGGGQDLEPHHPFYDTASYLLRLALKANDEGTHFPVWGTCLGFETLAIIISGNTSILGSYDSENLPSRLIYTPEAQHSTLVRDLPDDVNRNLQEMDIAMENHESGLSTEAVAANPQLDDFIRVVSTSKDRNNASYVSMFEAKKYPVYAVQWHPEKNAFEWLTHLDIPHSPQAVEATQAVARFLVNQARKNCHKPADLKHLESLLIYNYSPVFTGLRRYEGEEVDFDQCYFFPKRRAVNTTSESE